MYIWGVVLTLATSAVITGYVISPMWYMVGLLMLLLAALPSVKQLRPLLERGLFLQSARVLAFGMSAIGIFALIQAKCGYKISASMCLVGVFSLTAFFGALAWVRVSDLREW
jgi:hypothetical protein